MGNHRFDYDRLPWKEIGRLYREGWGWTSLAQRYGAPDHKTLAAQARQRLPSLRIRDHAASQRARRQREGTAQPKDGRR